MGFFWYFFPFVLDLEEEIFVPTIGIEIIPTFEYFK